MTIEKVEIDLAGKPITVEVGQVANQANGAVLLKCGGTVILATACMSAEPREGMAFFPLTCDYEERKYAVGKIPGGFVKRGGRPSEKAILTSRLIDRPTRPLFPEGMRNDVQLIAMPLSMELEALADVLAVNAASAALAISDIPWNGPLGCVRVCRVNGEFVVNPSLEQIHQSDMELIVAGTDGRVLEIELEASEVNEADLSEAMRVACDAIDKLVAMQRELVARIGKPKTVVPLIAPDVQFVEEIGGKINDELTAAIRNPEKGGKESAISQLVGDIRKRLAEEYPERVAEIPAVVEKLIKKQVRRMIVDESARPDGRRIDEIRPLSGVVGLLPRVHGSALFNRGQTQALTTVTLGSLDDAQVVDNLEEDTEKRFMHYYNFAPFSVGEVRFLRGAGRREVGHGILAEKALRPVIPAKDDFPYAMLVTTEVLESNGSTSMASVCACTLALMDAGVKITAPVAGISIGLVTGDDKEVLLTDIQGVEDFYGDMDFKVAGTRDGVTAMQVDTKTKGLSLDLIRNALEQARVARMTILDVIHETISEPRESLSQYAPRVFVVVINPDRIGDVIGPGGKIIKRIEAETGAKLDIEQDGHVYITSSDAAGGERAKQIVEDITREIKPGEVYTGKVVRIEAYGAFVEFLPGRDGMLHISQLAKERVNRVEDICNLGDEIQVRVLEIRDDGNIRLTRRGLTEDDQGYEPPPQERRDSGGSGGRGGGRPHGGPDRGPRGDRPPSAPSDQGADQGPKISFRPKR